MYCIYVYLTNSYFPLWESLNSKLPCAQRKENFEDKKFENLLLYSNSYKNENTVKFTTHRLMN